MFLYSWADVLTQSFQNLSWGIIQFLPNLLAAVIIFVLGWVIGALLGRLVAQVISAIKVDQALRSAGVDRIVTRAGFTLNAGAFLGALVKWFFIVLGLLVSLSVLGLNDVSMFLGAVVLGYLPQVIIAVLILMVAAVVAEAVQRIVSASAHAAGIRSANLLGAIARWAIWIFAILAALNHLQVANELIQPLFTGIVVAFALAFGLAFGLGGQQAAAKMIEKFQHEVK
ncbi:MAG: Small-conductance mechanosensitive ion channel-like protein [Parcubacteria bacterium C7867-007]|nr:MAG: Small-conductance mechanosensitive ion channel-like protein [Parcubacteria bacterium C7867-007]